MTPPVPLLVALRSRAPVKPDDQRVGSEQALACCQRHRVQPKVIRVHKACLISLRSSANKLQRSQCSYTRQNAGS
jgi:hypothetical protein